MSTLSKLTNWAALILALPCLLILLSWNSTSLGTSLSVKCSLEKIPQAIFNSHYQSPQCSEVLGIQTVQK